MIVLTILKITTGKKLTSSIPDYPDILQHWNRSSDSREAANHRSALVLIHYHAYIVTTDSDMLLFSVRRSLAHVYGRSLQCKRVKAFLCLYTNTSQSQASLSSCVWKRVDSALPVKE